MTLRHCLKEVSVIALRRSVLSFVVGVAILMAALPPTLAQTPATDAQRVRIVTVDFVLSGKLDKIGRLARDAQFDLDRLYVETASGEPRSWLDDAGLVILDTPRPMDLAKVQQRLGKALSETRTPWLRIGGGPPAFGNIPRQHARRLVAYYAGGGDGNLRAMFAYIRAWRDGSDTNAVAPPTALPATGFYHPAAPATFDSPDSYLAWGRDRWESGAPRVAFAIHSGLISGMETQVIDTLIARTEARGMAPLVFWFDAAEPDALQKLLTPASADVLVIATHLQNGPARKTEFLKLNIPVLQAIGYRDGDPQAWEKAASGMSQHLVAPFLAVPEAWGASDPLAEAFLDRLQYAYGVKDWGARVEGGNLFAEQLKGTQAAVLSRSSKLHGVLSTDHPFEYLGGLSLAVRHLDGKSPSLYVADLREQASRMTSAARFLADEMRIRTLNPHWISGMQQEGYAGTLELLNAVNNLWGWQVTDPGTMRADQWQAVHDTFVNDIRKLGLEAWFEQHNPTAQAQIVERMIESIRKGYWDATEQTRRELVERWRDLAEQHGVNIGEPATRAFVAAMAAGFGLQPAAEASAPQADAAGEQVRGPVLEPVTAPERTGAPPWQTWIALALLAACIAAGAFAQMLSNAKLRQGNQAT
jgi:cobalamin biosynthesis Mg chelatase CobN